ncbi:MAG: AfsR/SARP family transcriptional regulator [Anaerolineales bacterium]
MRWDIRTLSISTLGQLQITLDQRDITDRFRTDKERALLLYLANERGGAHRRESLAELLWPERPTGVGRTNLRQALLGVRKALGDQNAADPYILAHADTLEFNQGRVHSLDVAMLREHISAVKTHTHAHMYQCSSCQDHLQKAHALYQGDFLANYFLAEGFEFQEWMMLQRERYLREYIYILECLSRSAQQNKQSTQAVQYARELVQKTPLDESAHRLLMQLLAEDGKRTAAVEQFQECCTKLAQELGVEPGQETRALYEKIREGELQRPRQTHSLKCQSNLPLQLTNFIGRKRSLAWFDVCIPKQECRLITIVGMPGAGKTRLALEVGTRHMSKFRDGVWFAPVEGLQSTDQLVYTIGRMIGLYFDEHSPQRSQLISYLNSLETLLILDGFEHLIDSAELLIEILRHAPAVKILVTTQVRLNYFAACVHEIRGLQFPRRTDDTGAPDMPAVQLFIARAQRMRPEMEFVQPIMNCVMEICRLVEGLPLAIELAAAGLRTRTCQEIAVEIRTNLDSLGARQLDLPVRHQSIRAALDQAWLFLEPDERRYCARLAVFSGNFSIAAAQQVSGCSVEQLSSLAGKSLIQQNAHMRFWLQPQVRTYVMEKLRQNPEELDAAEKAHCRYFLEFVHQEEKGWETGRALCNFLEDLEIEIDNIRQAWNYALEQQNWPLVLNSLESLRQFFEIDGNLPEGVRWFQKLSAKLTLPNSPLGQLLFSASLAAEGWFYLRIGAYTSAIESLLKAQFQHETLASQQLRGWEPVVYRTRIFILNTLGFTASALGEHGKAREYFRNSLEIARLVSDLKAQAFAGLYLAELSGPDYPDEAALASYTSSLEVFAELGDQRGMLRAYIDLGDFAFHQLDFNTAERYYQAALEQVGSLQTGWASAAIYMKQGHVAQARGDIQQAIELNSRSLEIYQQIGDRRRIGTVLSRLGELACLNGCCDCAARYHDEALRLGAELGSLPMVLSVLTIVARCYASAGDVERARRILTRVLSHPAGQHSTQISAANLLAELEQQPNKPEDRVEVYHELLLTPYVRRVVDALVQQGEHFTFQNRLVLEPIDQEFPLPSM